MNHLFNPTTTKKLSHTHRQPMINAVVAVVTGGASRGVQTEYHLVPILEFAQAFRVPHDRTFGQFFEFSQHLLPFVHRVETLNPEHDFHLDLQGEDIAKRLVLRVD